MSSDLLITLAWLGSAAGISAVLSWIVANWPWFAQQTVQAQKLIKFGIAAIQSVGVWLITTYVPSMTLHSFQPVWLALFTAFVAVFGQETQQALAYVYQFWRADQYVALFKLVGAKPNGEMIAALFPRESVRFQQLIADGIGGYPPTAEHSGAAKHLVPKPS